MQKNKRINFDVSARMMRDIELLREGYETATGETLQYATLIRAAIDYALNNRDEIFQRILEKTF